MHRPDNAFMIRCLEMTRDTDELPKIMSELEESVKSVESAQ